MKKLFLSTCLLVLLSLSGRADVINDLIVFSNEGEKFILILNGERYNEVPAVRVTALGLTLPTYKVKVIFENKKLEDHNTTLYFYATGKEISFVLNKKGKKKHSMDYVSEKNMPGFTPVTDNSDVGDQTTTDTDTGTNTTTETNTNTTNTTNPTNTNSDANALSIKAGNLNIGLNEKGNIKLSSKEGDINLNTSDKSGDLSLGKGENAVNLHKKAVEPKIGCASPMSDTDFTSLKESVVSQSSDDNKLIAANALMDKNCFTTAQVKEIMKLFSTDESRLDFGKKAYAYTSDLDNYSQLKDTFSADEKKKEFNAFVKEQK